MKVLVSGLINLENSTNVHSFPIEYQPITYAFNEVEFHISGVVYNVLMALRSLGTDATPLTLLGEDEIGDMIVSSLVWKDINTSYCYRELEHTCTSTVLFDDNGARRIYCDLKDLQEKEVDIPEDIFDAYIITNTNFNAPLAEHFHKLGKPVFTDVHTLSDIHDEYNARFMRNADVLFLSNENIQDEKQFILDLENEYHNKVIVMGCGSEGALMLYNGEITKIAAIKTRTVKNTVGAGDALFSCFVHFYLKGMEPIECLRYATLFASYKISASGGAEGFLSEKELKTLYEKMANYIQ